MIDGIKAMGPAPAVIEAELISPLRRERLIASEGQALGPVLYVLNIAVFVTRGSSLRETGWSIAVPSENDNFWRQQIIDPDTGGVQRGGIGVAGGECGCPVAEGLPVR